jgi:uroporphyrinogen decarboxylase
MTEMGIFERSYLLLGMENALMAYYTNPDEMYALASAIADYKIAFLNRFIDVIRPDVIWYGDDWGMQSNLFLSPEVWRAIIRPHTQRIYDCIHSHGVLVKQHSCGKIDSIFGDLYEMGVDQFHPCQPCNDLKRLKKLYGDRVCFCGGIDSQFVLSNPAATPEDVRAEVRRRIDELALPDGGYLAAPSHSVPYDPAKLEAMNETIREYGRKIYEK